MLITVLTATYNRGDCIDNLYRSLCRQTQQDFQWLVIDDGSTDETEKYFLEMDHKATFSIDYYKKQNGGKHTALNYAHQYIKGELVFMVDSDDYLVDDAVECITNEWKKYCNRNDIGVLSFRCQSNGGRLLSTEVDEPYIDDDISFRVNHSISGDRSEVIRTELFCKYPLPEYPGERFMGEGWLFRHIAYNFKTVYYNRVIYVREYQEGGLSNAGRLLRMKCPMGMMENCRSYFVSRVILRVQIKQMLAYCTYGFCANESIYSIIKTSTKGIRIVPFIFPGWLLYMYWSKKYGYKLSKVEAEE